MRSGVQGEISSCPLFIIILHNTYMFVAHWRRMLERKEEAEKLRAESTSKRLRALYEKELELKESRKAEVGSAFPLHPLYNTTDVFRVQILTNLP